MKRYGNLWEQLISFENLHVALHKARRGKSAKLNVASFIYNAEAELLQMQEDLVAKEYRPGGYRTFYIYDKKPRLISAAPFRDRVVHHALCNVIEPLFEKELHL